MIAKIYEYNNGGEVSFSDKCICDGGSGWELEVELPDFLNPYETVCGDLAIQPEQSYAQGLSEILIPSAQLKPCIAVTYGLFAPETRYYNLKTLSRREISLAQYI